MFPLFCFDLLYLRLFVYVFFLPISLPLFAIAPFSLGFPLGSRNTEKDPL